MINWIDQPHRIYQAHLVLKYLEKDEGRRAIIEGAFHKLEEEFGNDIDTLALCLLFGVSDLARSSQIFRIPQILREAHYLGTPRPAEPLTDWCRRVADNWTIRIAWTALWKEFLIHKDNCSDEDIIQAAFGLGYVSGRGFQGIYRSEGRRGETVCGRKKGTGQRAQSRRRGCQA